jgi:hypothetical protein
MSNDIDLWNDIEDLESLGLKKEAEDLLEAYRKEYIEVEE